ncbi:MAG TPA: riboflavin synthase [Chitinophagales bacterium]|nr:riboflavin synthase [Chitinophagales bacterium]
MFTGIIETFGKVVDLKREGENVHFYFETPITNQLKIDQSVAHNGVCLTVVEITDDVYKVTAIQETLVKTNLGSLTKGDIVNIERAMQVGDRLDGHIVQGHVDTVAVLKDIQEADGSKEFYFELSKDTEFYLVDKGSVCIDGVSLTVVEAEGSNFHVAIIPYTLEHTIFHQYKIGDVVNIEFDVIGKYIQRYLNQMQKHLK